ncbi:MAG: twin-arginine translocation signal domain-containing protein, partial [Pseudomonadales bacterium]|nr:twin-arginine translocation signal domain-containing protein [Pseudomonadales bacterium]
MGKRIDRRSLLKLGALTGLASGLGLKTSPAGAQAGPQGVRQYVRLGRTELEISDISFGSSRLRTGEEDLVRHAL